jgi:hypothetical protein
MAQTGAAAAVRHASEPPREMTWPGSLEPPRRSGSTIQTSGVSRADGGLDRSRGRVAAGRIIVERENGSFDAQLVEALEQAGRGGQAAERGDTGDVVGTERLYVEHTFDEHEATSRVLLSGREQAREPVRDMCRSLSRAEVEVARLFPGVDRPRPERADALMLVAPGADDATRPALVGEQLGGIDLALRVAGAQQRQPQPIVVRHDAELGGVDALTWDAALLEVGAGGCAVVAGELAARDLERFVEETCAPLGRTRRPVEDAGVDAGALGQCAQGVDEVAPAGGLAVVEVGRPEHRALAVDQKAARRLAVADDAVGSSAQQRARVLGAGSDPAACVAAPAELGEGLVEAAHERRQHVALVEVGDVGTRSRGHASSPLALVAAPAWEAVDRDRRDLAWRSRSSGPQRTVARPGPPAGASRRAPAAATEARADSDSRALRLPSRADDERGDGYAGRHGPRPTLAVNPPRRAAGGAGHGASLSGVCPESCAPSGPSVTLRDPGSDSTICPQVGQTA